MRAEPVDDRGRLRRFIDFIHLGLLVRLGLLFALLQYNRNANDIRSYYIAGDEACSKYMYIIIFD